MARTSRAPDAPYLVRPRAAVQADLDSQIAAGEVLAARSINGEPALHQYREDVQAWDGVNRQILRQACSTSALHDEYVPWASAAAIGFRPRSVYERAEEERDDLRRSLGRLKAVRAQLPYVPETALTPPAVQEDEKPTNWKATHITIQGNAYGIQTGDHAYQTTNVGTDAMKILDQLLPLIRGAGMAAGDQAEAEELMEKLRQASSQPDESQKLVRVKRWLGSLSDIVSSTASIAGTAGPLVLHLAKAFGLE